MVSFLTLDFFTYSTVWLNGNPGARNASLRLLDAPVCGISDAIQLVYSICHKNGYYKECVVIRCQYEVQWVIELGKPSVLSKIGLISKF